MKILYSVQATGNGHISRAVQLFPIFKKYGHVDVFLSGNNSSLVFPYPVKYRSKGVSLYYGNQGQLDYFRTVTSYQPMRILREAKSLPVEEYDLIINDFEHITSRACKLKEKASIHFGHQASFLSSLTPRPRDRSMIGEAILRHYAEATDFVGLHFEKYDNRIELPIIRDRIIRAQPKNNGHITIYLPSYHIEQIKAIINQCRDFRFHVFSNFTKNSKREGHVTYQPIDQELFTVSIESCYGIITGAGFETPAEALYLKKKMMIIPIANHYEQACNAAALKDLGVSVYKRLSLESFNEWITGNHRELAIEANDINNTVQTLMELDSKLLRIR